MGAMLLFMDPTFILMSSCSRGSVEREEEQG